jgi:hypothetical protein
MCAVATIPSIAYLVFAEPIMEGGTSLKLRNIQMSAHCSAATNKVWTTSCEELSRSLGALIGKRRAYEFTECLRCGQRMTLPGTYSPLELVSLGLVQTRPNSR